MASKKSIIVLLCIVILLSMTGCRIACPMTPSIGALHTDYEGVELRITAIDYADGEVKLQTQWHNATSHEVMYGEAYVIEREEDGQWIQCPTKLDNICFIAIGYLLPAGKDQEKTYTVTSVYDISAPGKYRIRTDCTVGITPCELWAEFTMAEEGAVESGTAPAPEVSSAPTEASLEKECGYKVQYIRTDGYYVGTKYPSVVVIDSVDALNAYYEENKDTFDLARRERVYSDTTIGFLDACDSYTEAFFQEHYLILYRVEECSGSIRHEVSKVAQTEAGKLLIEIDSIVPEVCTDDMAQWHIILEMERHGEVPAVEDIIYPIPPTCGETASGKIYTKPPVLTVVGSDGSIQAEKSTYSWLYTDENGQGNGICVDALHPLYCQDFVAPFYASGEVKLLFEEEPDSVAVRCWSDKYWNSSAAKESEVTLEQGVLLTLNPDGHIYEITASWNREDRAYSGEVIYYFYAVPYTINYQQGET